MKLSYFLFEKHWNSEGFNLEFNKLSVSQEKRPDGSILIKIGEILDYELSDDLSRVNLVGDGKIILVKPNEVVFVNDKLSYMWVYYYSDEDKLVISSNFWEILKRLSNVEFDDFYFKESLFTYKSKIFTQTFIKNVYIVPHFSYIRFKKAGFHIHKYGDIKYDKTNDVKIASKDLYKALNGWIEYISNKYNENPFLIAFSGGWDSRIALHLVASRRKDIICYTIGKSRPNKFFLSLDHKNVEILTNEYNLVPVYLEYNSAEMEAKTLLDIVSNPVKPSNILKSVPGSFPDDSILISGGAGVIIGGGVFPEYIDELSDKDLKNLILKYFTLVYERRYDFVGKIESFKKFFFGGAIKFFKMDFVDKSWLADYERKLLDHINSSKTFLKKSNFEIISEIEMTMAGKFGAFESLNDQYYAFSIYYPLAFEVSLKWKPECFFNRRAMFRMIEEKIPALLKVQGQSMYLSNQKLRTKLLQLIRLVIRGKSLDYQKWTKDRNFKVFSKKVLERSNPAFEDLSNLKLSNQFINRLIFDNSFPYTLKENILKFKVIVDIIENKLYKELGADFDFDLIKELYSG